MSSIPFHPVVSQILTSREKSPSATSSGLSNIQEALAQSSTSQETLDGSATGHSSPAESQTELPAEKQHSNGHVPYVNHFGAPAALPHGQGGYHPGGQQLDENHRVVAAKEEHTNSSPATQTDDENKVFTFVQSHLDSTLAESQSMAPAAGHVFQGQQPYVFLPPNKIDRPTLILISEAGASFTLSQVTMSKDTKRATPLIISLV